jgi:ProP effector
MSAAMMQISSIKRMIAVLAERFPAAFFVRGHCRKPLKVGIRDDLVAVAPDLHPATLRAALRCYTGNAAYLDALRRDTVRVDLAGAPAGTVSADQANFAAELLARRMIEALAKAERAKAAAATAAPTPPGRLSLAGLRDAGRARAAGGQT